MNWSHVLAGHPVGVIAWWEMCLRAAVVFLAGLVLIRLAGKRIRGRWGAMDIILFMIIGSNLSRALTGNAPLMATLMATSALVGLHSLMATLSVSVPQLGSVLKGRPEQIVRRGRLDADAMRRQTVGRGDLDEALRLAGLRSLDHVEEAWIERNGLVSVIARAANER